MVRKFIDTTDNAPRADRPWVSHHAIAALVKHRDYYLGMRWKQIDWETLVTGEATVKEGLLAAALREVREETGYIDVLSATRLPAYESEFYHGPKGVNKRIFATPFLIVLDSRLYLKPSQEELAKHEPVWLTQGELKNFRLPEAHRYVVEQAGNRAG
jgi:ADP-ribose pyrophosphatase YjhB (NUDIX family)